MKAKLLIQIRNRYYSAILALLVAVGLFAFKRHILLPEIQDLTHEYQVQQQQGTEIQNIEAATKTLIDLVAQTGKSFVNILMEKDNYIEELGNLAKKHQLNISTLTSEDIIPITDSSFFTLPIQITVQGTAEQIATFIHDVHDDNRLVTIAGMSYRIEQPYSWMWRALDEDEPLSWWDISTYELPEDEEQTNLDLLDSLSTDELLRTDQLVRCSLNLHLIGDIS